MIGGTGVRALFLATFLATWFAVQRPLHRRAEMEAVLKKELLDRGRSADEIKRVVAAPHGVGQAVRRCGRSARAPRNQ